MLQRTDGAFSVGKHPDHIPYFMVNSEVHDPGVYPAHSHDYFEVLLLLSGKRIQHIGSDDIVAEEGDLLFLAPGTQHGATRQTKNQTLIIGFNLSFLHPEMPLEASRAWDRPAALETAPEILPFVAQSKVNFSCGRELVEALRTMAMDMMINNTMSALGARTQVRSQLSLFLLRIVRSFEHEIVDATHDHRPMPQSTFADNLAAFVQANLAKPVSIEDAARFLFVSPSCLASRVRRATGLSFSELLSTARLKRARELLVFTDTRISEIAYACGFEDNSYFSRRFRQMVGMTPGEYRQRMSTSARDDREAEDDVGEDVEVDAGEAAIRSREEE